MFDKTTAVGRIANDLVLRETSSGAKVLNISLPLNKKVQGEEVTIWTRWTAWGRTAETIAQYFAKGHRVLLEGELEAPETWESDNRTNVTLKFRVNSFSFIESRAEAEAIGGTTSNSTTTTSATSEVDVTEIEIPF